MFKKCVLKFSNSLSTINYMRSSKNSSSRCSSTSDEDRDGCSCDCDYNEMELNRDLFIENYLIGRGVSKMRSASLSAADDELQMMESVARRNNNRRKSLMEKRDDHLKINRNHLFHKTDKSRAVTKHKISVNVDDFYGDEFSMNDFDEIDDEKTSDCDFIGTTAPTMRKINNNLREFVNMELSKIVLEKNKEFAFLWTFLLVQFCPSRQVDLLNSL